MYCNKCGKKNPNDVAFCNGFGGGIGNNYQNDRTLNEIQKTPVKTFTSLLLGIISLLFIFFFNMMVGLVLAIVGVTFDLVGIKKSLQSYSTEGFRILLILKHVPKLPIFIMQ